MPQSSWECLHKRPAPNYPPRNPGSRVVDDSVAKTLADQSADLDRIIKEAQRLGDEVNTISDFNDGLTSAEVIATDEWRFIQHLGALRNLCDHDKQVEPTKEHVGELIDGVAKTIKTLF